MEEEIQAIECPICGTDEYDDIYIDKDGNVVGCSYCMTTKSWDAYATDVHEENYESWVDSQIDARREARYGM